MCSARIFIVLPVAVLLARADHPASDPAGNMDTSRTVRLPGHLHPLAQPRFDRGRVAPETAIGPVILSLTKTAGQQADLEKLLLDQRDLSSANYHRWLTPEQYAARFGASVSDSNRVARWLRSQGLSVERIARGKNWIAFTGTAAQVGTALHTELHRYSVDGEMHFALADEPSIPADLAPVVGGFLGLDDFDRPTTPRYTYPSGTHQIAPDDFATIYDVAPLYSAGITGAGQRIAIAASSNILVSDIRAFRKLFGLAANDPQIVVYGPDPGLSGGQNEATGDIEAAMGVARDATIVLVATTNALNSVAHAVDDALAPVIGLSSGSCENLVTANQPLLYRAIAQQANAEGITWVTGSSDSGATACEAKGATPLAGHGLAIGFPAGIPEVTATGGTQFIDDDAPYWSATNSPTGSSARSYIPEVAWDEISSSGFLATGGGASVLYPKPAWQTGPGVPRDGARDVPDISLIASCEREGFVGILNGTETQVLCGTSASAPAFAGVLALLNQYLVSNGALQQPGLGNVNPELYRLAQTSPAVFHDITAGSNIVPCLIGTLDCATGSEGYTAGPGYDLATGLGSIDVFKLVTQWNTAGATVTTLSAGAGSLAISGSVQMTANVAAAAGSQVPTGAVTFNAGSQVLGVAPLAASGVAAIATITVYGSQLVPGKNSITAVYSGDANLNGSAGSVSVAVSVPSANSAIVPAIAPNPVYQTAPDSNGSTFQFSITLSETAGLPTTLTGFTIDGASQPLSTFFPSPAIPANGTISVPIATTAAVVPVTRVYGFSGRDASGFTWLQQTTVYFFGPRLPGIAAVSNAASGDAVALAPGSIASVYGLNLSGSTAQASAVPLPLSLAGVTATVNGIPAPLYFVSPRQVNLQIPYEVASGSAVVSIRSAGQDAISASGPIGSPVSISPTGPGIFVDGQGNTVPFAGGSRGQTLTLFVTGFGAVSPPVATGAAPAPGTPVSQLPAPTAPIGLTIGGETALVTFAGIPAGLVGVLQVNFQVPGDAPLGPQPVVVTVAGRPSKAAAAFTVTQ